VLNYSQKHVLLIYDNIIIERNCKQIQWNHSVEERKWANNFLL